jgi:hypothetical protein
MATDTSPNLYDFLRQIRDQAAKGVPGAAPISRDLYVTLTRNELAWLEHFLKTPDQELHFKGKRVGGTADNPVVAQDYMIAGDQVDIFSLLTEAMMQNPTFAQLVQGAAKFFQDHVPSCPHCKAAVLQHAMQPSWEFAPHPDPNREHPCPECPTGEMEAEGFTQPNGRADYRCNVCGHEASFP